MRLGTTLLLTAALALAGCLQTSGAEVDADGDGAGAGDASADGNAHERAEGMRDLYADARERVYDDVGGGHQSQHRIEIPPGTTKLVVRATYAVSGGAQFHLANPALVTQGQEQVGGTKHVWDEEWVVVEDPVPGTWTLSLQVGGTAEYAFGFYY